MFSRILRNRYCILKNACKRKYSAIPKTQTSLEIGGKVYCTDDFTNITPKILGILGTNLHLKPNNPLCLIRKKVINFFYEKFVNTKGNPLFSVYNDLNPIVTVEQNFDNLLIPKDHPSRAKSDCYYVNRSQLLRAHTTAHQVDLIRSGLDNFLICGEVFRRDEIDSTHYPVFHQVIKMIDAVRLLNKQKLFKSETSLEIFETEHKINEKSIITNNTHLKQNCHTLEAVKLAEHELKQTLIELSKSLFGSSIETRWTDTQFPFTYPSWELEIYNKGCWLEVLGCGIIRNEILQNSGIIDDTIGYAFGIGLERLAMVLYDIPDIRLFWSKDSGFLSQFDEKDIHKNIKYKPVSVYPQCINDLSFWLPENQTIADFTMNDFHDVARDIAGNTLEQVKLVDSFVHPKNGKTSLCFRLTYRHMERTLTQAEVNKVHANLANAVKKAFGVTIR